MNQKNYLQNIIDAHTEIMEMILDLAKELSNFKKINSFKGKIESSVRIKEIESAIFNYTDKLKEVIFEFRKTEEFSNNKEYIGLLISEIQKGIKKVSKYKRFVFNANRKSKFLQKLKSKKYGSDSSNSTTNEDTAGESALALI